MCSWSISNSDSRIENLGQPQFLDEESNNVQGGLDCRLRQIFFSTGDVPFLATDRAPVRFSPLFDGLFSAISCILP